jgi:hypothetical protein
MNTARMILMLAVLIALLLPLAIASPASAAKPFTLDDGCLILEGSPTGIGPDQDVASCANVDEAESLVVRKTTKDSQRILTVDGLLTAIVTWLSVNFDFPAIYDHPRIELLRASQISNLKYAAVNRVHRREVVALYDDTRRVIYLSDLWRGRSPAELSVLVHEMVHHFQNLSGTGYACLAAREEIAYAAQDRWLKLFGRNLFDEFDLDPLTLRVATLCPLP